MKFRIDSPAQSEALQNVLFGLGYFWWNRSTIADYLSSAFLYTAKDNFLSYGTIPENFDKYDGVEQNTNDFIAKHTKKENMTNSNTATELTFDINADISRQYTRDGRKVLAIHKFYDAHLVYPISAIVEGTTSPVPYVCDGRYYSGDDDSNMDIITRPIEKPLIVDYLNVYNDGAGYESDHRTYQDAAEAARGIAAHMAVIKLTFNPNDNSVSAEVVTE